MLFWSQKSWLCLRPILIPEFNLDKVRKMASATKKCPYVVCGGIVSTFWKHPRDVDTIHLPHFFVVVVKQYWIDWDKNMQIPRSSCRFSLKIFRRQRKLQTVVFLVFFLFFLLIIIIQSYFSHIIIKWNSWFDWRLNFFFSIWFGWWNFAIFYHQKNTHTHFENDKFFVEKTF